MEKLRIILKNDEAFSCLQKNKMVDKPMRDFIKEHIKIKVVETDEIIGGKPVLKEILDGDYEITITINKK